MEIKNLDKFIRLLVAGLLIFYKDYFDENNSPTDVPEDELHKEYDFIIVGGGSAGCVLANRLSEISYWKIILIEAGGNEPPISSVPYMWYVLKNTILDWNATTVPQKRACQDNDGICSITRGRALGGNSVLDNMVHERGNRRDFDRLRSEYNIKGWSYKEMLPYFKKSENATALYVPRSKYRGYNGPLHLECSNYHTKIQEDYFRAAKEVNLTYLKTDYNAKIQEDTMAYPQLTMKDQMRFSAARAYLYPVKDRDNLHIIKNSFVVKIIFKKKKAVGVEYIRDGQTCRLRARKEVIISAGPFNSAKLLMLSGIGPKMELTKIGISSITDLPVGQGLRVQPCVYTYVELNKKVTLTTDVWRTKESIEEYLKYKQGPLTLIMDEVDWNGTVTSKEPPTVGYLTYSYRLIYDAPQYKQVITVPITLENPVSTGSMSLQSIDPYVPPLIDPNYLSEKKDYDLLSRGISDQLIYLNAPSMQKYSPKIFTDDQPKCKGLNGKSYVRCLMKNYVDTEDRAVGTTSIGTVVDEDLCLKGFKNVRVVGSCILPITLTGYADGATYAIAEKLADIIKNFYEEEESTTEETDETETEETSEETEGTTETETTTEAKTRPTKRPKPSQFQQAVEAFNNLAQIMQKNK